MKKNKRNYIFYKKIFFTVVFFFSFHTTFALSCDFLQTSTVLYPRTINQDIFELQKFLNLDPDTTIAKSGPGSSGKETKKYGEGTFFAVKRFQEKYAKEILWPLDLYTGTGVFGFSSKSKMYALYCAKKEASTIPVVQVMTTSMFTNTVSTNQPIITASSTGTLLIISPTASSTYKIGYTIPFDIRLLDDVNVSTLAVLRNGALMRETPLLFAGKGGYTTNIDTSLLSEGDYTFTVIAKSRDGYIQASSSVLVSVIR